MSAVSKSKYTPILGLRKCLVPVCRATAQIVHRFRFKFLSLGVKPVGLECVIKSVRSYLSFFIFFIAVWRSLSATCE